MLIISQIFLNLNWFLFKKLFWSISLSKKIIPNAKILQKLGIPQWSWPYSGIKKKGYPSQAPLDLTQSILSYSWPFSLLMSPTIIKINNKKKVNLYKNNFSRLKYTYILIYIYLNSSKI